MSFEESSIAFSGPSDFKFIENLWVGKLAGGEGKLPTIGGRAVAGLDMVPRRELTAIGNGPTLSPASSRAAATAATLAAVPVMLFRRVTRWVALRAPDKAEYVWELLREWDNGLEAPKEDAEVEEID